MAKAAALKIASPSVSIPVLYRAGVEMYQTQIDYAVFRDAKRNPIQRFEQQRLDLPHLNNWHPKLQNVAIAVMPNGTIYIIDGHSRLANMENGRLPKVAKFNADVYPVMSIEEVKQHYKVYDSLSAAKSGKDTVQSAFAAEGFYPRTKWISTATGVAAALNIVCKAYVAARPKEFSSPKLNHYEKVTLMIEPLRLLDELEPENSLFKQGFAAAALAAFKMHDRNALAFFRDYSLTSGNTNGQYGDAVWQLRRFLGAERQAGTMTSNHPERHAQVALGCYLAYLRSPTRLLERMPRQKSLIEFFR